MRAPRPIEPGFRLADVDPDSTPDASRDEVEADLEATEAELSELQERLFAQSRGAVGSARSILLVLQGIDTSGKGGILRHVVGLIDPQGVRITSFAAPTEEERAHDFLWRIRPALPAPGIIGVFDRSHYEDVLVHRVRGLTPLEEVEQRYGVIRDFEAALVSAGTVVRKVMLQISPDEQKQRLADRLDRPDKHWKFSPSDIDDRLLWDDYQAAYQIAIERTSTPDAPWYVIPANRKWYARWAVQRILLEALREIDPQWPPAAFDVELEKARLAAS